MGLPAITALGLVKQVDTSISQECHSEIVNQYPSVFTGLGTWGEEYKIQLREDATPFALFTPRRVPFPLREKVRKELERMEQLGVISRVDEPTPWCAGLVVVPKKSGEVRLCVDLKPLNEAVLREVHPIPGVDETLAKLSGARVFSKLDANSGYWQIPLAEESCKLTQPLRELLSSKVVWTWGSRQQEAFKNVKEELSKPTVLAKYDPQAPLKVSADSSSFGIGAVLLQRSEETWKPVVYASRALSETERRYAQIEKEALAVTWACEKFLDYILGRKFELETDHKPLIPLLSNKQLDLMPPRILRFRLRLSKFDYTISHVPGKFLYTADALSRAPVDGIGKEASLQNEAEAMVDAVVQCLPTSPERFLESFKSRTKSSKKNRKETSTNPTK